ncbi:MAG: hypothetical protein J0L84_02875 [Verrucomicrobia bacterium]|nr:hypothetical protein [Verrucomicrobiota bacterium]
MSSRRTSPAWSSRVAGVLSLLWAATGCSPEPAPPVAPSPPAGVVAADPEGPASDRFQDSLPRQGGPEGYVGSEVCRSCHSEQFQSWHRSYHRTMTQYATPETVRADFHDVVLTNAGTRFHLGVEGEELRVHMERIAGAEATDEVPAALDTRVSLVTGSHHMQVFWVPGGSGNTQVGFPFTWLIPEARWVPRNTTFLRPPGAPHATEVWNVMCSRCHATAIEPRVDSVNRVMDSRAAELGISCEACHGPGQRHVTAREAAGASASRPAAEILRSEIRHPEGLDPVRASETCGFCHSMKWIDRSESWRTHGFRFRPGDSLEATTPLIQPARAERVSGLQEYLAKNPGLLNDYFWSDGMVRVSGREYNGLEQSPCFQGGRFSCLSCHSIHDSDPNDLLSATGRSSQACTQCHEAYRDAEALGKHTHHLPGSSGGDCYNCHMPHTTYGVLSAIRSHQVSSPRVADALATGRPNACNLCHLDRTLEWTAQHLTGWFGHPAPALSETQKTVADSVRLALSGDAGQRVLMAWHLGWEPARQASGTSWIPPFLGLLLDDPYAAVRCVADRSLRATAPALRPSGYDYVVDPAERRPAWESVWGSWVRETAGTAAPPLPAAVLVRPETDLDIQRQLGPLLEARDERPIRLRE